MITVGRVALLSTNAADAGKFVYDTFTGAAAELSTHTGEVGATWVKHSFGGTDVSIDGAGSLLGNAGGTSVAYYASGTPSSADYAVTAVLNRVGTPGADLIAIAGRINTAASTWYMLSVAGNDFQLFKVIAGTPTTIGPQVQATGWAPGDTVRMTLGMTGTAITGRLQRISDNLWLNPTGPTWQAGQVDLVSATDSAITAAGKAGVAWMVGLLWKFDSISAREPVISGSPTGTAAVTEAPDTLAASGTNTPPTFTGTLARTEAADTLVASGTNTPPTLTGTLAVTEAPDTLAAAGTNTAPGFTGTLAVTEAADTVVASGTNTPPVVITGTAAVTEANDTMVGIGTNTAPGAVGTVAAKLHPTRTLVGATVTRGFNA